MKYEVSIKKNGQKIIPILWVNGKEDMIDVTVKLVEEGAQCIIVGIFLGGENKSVTFNTHVIHEAQKTKSLTTIRGVFKDHAGFNNDGLVKIDKGAKGADGYFASKILLFDDAKGRSVPSLEIDENDLKAGHASTVGRPDKQQLFYLQSRGIALKEAEQLLVKGFFQPVIDLLPEKDRSIISQQIDNAL